MTNKTTEALKSIRAILAEPDDEETISKIREALAEQEKQEPVAVISESAIGLVKLHANGVSLPFGTPLYAAPVSAPKQEPVAWWDGTKNFVPFSSAPVDAKAIRAEALEEAAQECDEWASVKPFSAFASGSAAGAQNCAAAIRGLK